MSENKTVMFPAGSSRSPIATTLTPRKCKCQATHLVPPGPPLRALSRVQRDSLWVAIGPRGNNGNARRSFAFAQAFGRRSIPLNHAGLTEQSRRGPNAAPTRQAGGHWFEPSTAHRKALQKSRCCLLSRRRDVVGWQRL